MSAPQVDPDQLQQLAELVKEHAVVHGREIGRAHV